MSYMPAKFLQVFFNVTSENATWDHNDGTGDPWIGYPYRWNVTLTVTAQPHGSHQTTPEQYYYDGRNVKVGDYIVSSAEGFIVKIISISAQTSNSVTCVVEDVDRGNIFQDASQTGSGVGGNGNGYLFEVSEDGYPILYPLPQALAGTVPTYFADNIITRFMKEKRSLEVTVDQVAHGFDLGQAIYLKADGDYALAQSDDPATSDVIGVVTQIDVPGPDRFKYRPVGPLLNVTMPTATPGSAIYLSDTTPGALTATSPLSNIRKVFIYVSPTSGIYLGQGGGGGGGERGFQGPAGGPQGFRGFQGFQGNIGTQGNTGFQGFQGTAGTNGTQGLTGNQGNNGFQGNTGNQGNTGTQGNTGLQGNIGNQGNTGFQGVNGSIGIDGTQGFRGFQGYQGNNGTGTQGSTGTQGVSGLQGIQGPAGGGGGGDITGTGTSPQIAIWSNTTELTGVQGLTFENNLLILADTATTVYIPHIETQITANQDNYTPIQKGRNQFWSTDGFYNITGLDLDQVDGQEHIITNNGLNSIVLVQQSIDSTDVNRFLTVSGNDVVLNSNESATVRYIGGAVERWLTYKNISHVNVTIEIREVEYFTLDSTAISNKFVTLNNTPTNGSDVSLDIVGGTSQLYGIDFEVISQNLSWDALSLESELTEGDILRVIYTWASTSTVAG